MSVGFYVLSNEVAVIQIKNGSEVVIEGKSNLNRFTCAYNANISQGSSAVTYNIIDNTYLLEGADLTLRSNQFDCGGRLINKDFNELMQTDEYPHISIKLNHIKAKKDTYAVNTAIKIAGKSKTYTFEMCHTQNHNYTGELSLNIEDFDMQAPKKLMGAIKVDPVIVINFDMDLVINQH